MPLKSFGWNTFFEKSFKPFSGEYFPARVCVQHANAYELYTERGDATAELTGKLRFAIEQGSAVSPAIGDWVVIKFTETDERAMIHDVLPRRSKFSRKVVGEETREQIIAANVDLAILVSGLDQDFNLRRIERYLATVKSSGAESLIVLNKSDLCSGFQERVAEVRAVEPTVPVVPMTALDPAGLDALRFYLEPGKTSCLLGSSGVGKSTLINALLGSEIQKTREVMDGTYRGRHTTTHRELFTLPGGSLMIDTPGMRELQLWTDAESLDDAFEDIEALARLCKFSDCRHDAEPDCAVKAALEDGTLDAARYRNYLKMQKEVRYLALRQDFNAMRLEKMRWKKIHADQKKFYKGR